MRAAAVDLFPNFSDLRCGKTAAAAAAAVVVVVTSAWPWPLNL